MPLMKTGNLTLPTATGNFDVTGLGFQPTGIILYHEQSGTGDLVALISHIGFADAAGNQISNFTIATGRSATGAVRRSTTNKVISRTNTSGTVVSEATATMIADGFRLNFTTATAGGLQFRYIAFKDVPIKVGMFTGSTATSASGSVTGMSFKPAAMMGLWLAGSGTASSAAGHGFVDSALKQYSSVGNNNSASGSLYASEPNFVSVYSPTGYAGRLTITALNSNGFSYTTGATGSSSDYGYFAIGGVQANLVDVIASATGSVAYTGVGFKPQSLLNHFVYTDPTPGAIYTSGWGLADPWGVVDDTLTQAYHNTVGLNGAANTKVRYSSTANGFGRTPFGTPSITPYIEGNLTSFDTDGFTINWNNTDASVAIWKTLALAVAPTTNTTTQTGNARIEKTLTLDQVGNARIERTGTITQVGNSRIERVNTLDQIGNATIVPAAVVNTITQVGNARIKKINTLTQVGNARISKVGSIDQIGAAVIARLNTIDQIGNATITNPYPDKLPQEWEDSQLEQPAAWTDQDQVEQQWASAEDKAETTWEKQPDPLDQQWSDSNKAEPTEWQRQYYD